MCIISIVFHSRFGHTRLQAEAVAKGVRSNSAVEALYLININDIDQHWDSLNRSDAIIFGSPTYFGDVSAAFKTFMERTSQIWAEQKWKDKLAAGFTNSNCHNGDKLNTLIQLAIFAAQHGMQWTSLGLKPGDYANDKASENLNRFGSWLGAMAQALPNNNANNLNLLPDCDLRTAEYLGKRLALSTLRWTKAKNISVI